MDAVIHFAGLKAVVKSQKEPLKYFENNISGSISLVKAMERAQVFKLVFSSSGDGLWWSQCIAIVNEDMLTGMPSNNYGYTKLIVSRVKVCCWKTLGYRWALVDCIAALF